MMKLKRNGIKKGMKRFALRRSGNRISRKFTLTNDVNRIQVEVYQYIASVNSSTTIQHSLSSADYCSIATIMAYSTSWADNYSLYSRYKIYGLGIRVNYSLDRATIAASYGGKVPNLAVCFYPNFSSTSVGDSPDYNDHKLYVESNNDKPQSKYYRFPDNFYDGGASGFGVWSSTNSYASQIGQLSISNAPNTTATAVISFAIVKYTLYILLSDKNR